MTRTAKRDLTRQQQLTRGPIDLPFLGLTVLLLGIGLVMLLSASSYAASQSAASNYDGMYYFKRQAAFAVVGLVAMYFISKFDYRRLYGLSGPLIFVAILLLIAVLVPHVGITRNNATRWLKIGVEFQPSEIAKIAVVLFFAAWFSKRDKDHTKQLKKRYRQPVKFLRKVYYKSFLCDLLVPVLLLAIILLLLAKEPHLSGAILIFCAAAAIILVSGTNLVLCAVGGGVGVLGVVYMLFIRGYNSSRILTWQNPWWDPTDKSYQIVQSIYAVASGGLSGLGFGLSRQKYLYLPYRENDFIFSIICEELGFIGAMIIIALFALLIIRGYWLALHARDRFGSLIIVGCITLLAVQVFLNIAVVINLIPATGISLPFFSYGGTALVIQLCEVGVILSVSRQIPAPPQET